MRPLPQLRARLNNFSSASAACYNDMMQPCLPHFPAPPLPACIFSKKTYSPKSGLACCRLRAPCWRCGGANTAHSRKCMACWLKFSRWLSAPQQKDFHDHRPRHPRGRFTASHGCIVAGSFQTQTFNHNTQQSQTSRQASLWQNSFRQGCVQILRVKARQGFF